jgi:hypothetical protein
VRIFASLAALTLLASNAFAADPPVIKSAKSGSWSAAATWEGNAVPGAGARVLIREGHTITYDARSDAVIRAINVAGTLAFAPDKDTVLNVGLIKIQPGEEYSEDGFDCEGHGTKSEAGKPVPALLVGTPDTPIAKSALIRLHHVEGMNKETCPAIVCCGGRMDFHGQPLSRTWVKLGSSAKIGDSAVTLVEEVKGWKVGDRVIVTGTQVHGNAKTESYTEERHITALESTKLTLDKALTMAHLGEGEYRAEVANLSRNVVVESATPADAVARADSTRGAASAPDSGVRGHTMYHKHSAGSLSYTEFRHLGKKDILGKYAIHFHLCRDTMRGSSVVGCSIWDSHNRWVTIHGTDYLVVRDNVGYKSVGHGYFLEDGTETYNVLDHNLAVGAVKGKKLPKQALPFDGNEGAGFWWTCSLNSFTRNIATECGNYGFRYEATSGSSFKTVLPIRQPDGSRKEVDVRTLPFVRFEDNEVHSSHGLYGVNFGEGVNRVGPDDKHPFVVKNLKIWDVHYGFRPQVPNLVVENLHIHKVAYGVYHPNYDGHFYKNVFISQTHTEPFNRGHDDLSVQYGLLVVDGLTFDECRSGGMPLIQISDDNPTGNGATHMRGVKTVNWADTNKQRAIANLGGGPRPTPKTEKGVPIYFHDYFGPGRVAMVVSMKSGEFKANATTFREEKDLTGNESRVMEVKDVAFPAFPQLTDDLAPATIITSASKKDGKLVVRGSTLDNGAVKRVVVNGKEAKSVAGNFAEWEITLDSATELKAHAEDAAGNVEKTPAVVAVK